MSLYIIESSRRRSMVIDKFHSFTFILLFLFSGRRLLADRQQKHLYPGFQFDSSLLNICYEISLVLVDGHCPIRAKREPKSRYNVSRRFRMLELCQWLELWLW